jgi:electron transfer flavoprotein alpha subunit
MELDYLQALVGETIEDTGPAYRGILVVAERRGDHLAEITREILGRARELADQLGAHVTTAIFDAAAGNLPAEAIACGSDAVLAASHPGLADVAPDAYARLLAALIEEKKPEIVLFGATARGRACAPRVAARLNTGLLPECVAIDLDENERLLLGTRATYGDLLWCTSACPTARPQIATVRPGWLRAALPDHSRDATVEQWPVTLAEADRLALSELGQPPHAAPPLTDARVVVAGGRGMGGAAGFAQLGELAGLLGGAVAASRSAVELGWADRAIMVDVTGHAVHPYLYIATGISGTFSHRLATRGARCLVAINNDPDAPIMKKADIGIVGDWREVVPALITAIKEVKQR